MGIALEDEATAQAWRQLATDDERRTWAAAIASGVTIDRRRRAISVTGRCPACECQFHLALADGEVLIGVRQSQRGRITGPDGADDVDWEHGTLRFEVPCYCETVHRGRPSFLSHGCGAAGWLVDEPDPALAAGS